MRRTSFFDRKTIDKKCFICVVWLDDFIYQAPKRKVQEDKLLVTPRDLSDDSKERFLFLSFFCHVNCTLMG